MSRQRQGQGTTTTIFKTVNELFHDLPLVFLVLLFATFNFLIQIGKIYVQTARFDLFDLLILVEAFAADTDFVQQIVF